MIPIELLIAIKTVIILFILILPGWLLSRLLLDPHDCNIDHVSRLAVSQGLSVVMTPLAIFITNTFFGFKVSWTNFLIVSVILISVLVLLTNERIRFDISSMKKPIKCVNQYEKMFFFLLLSSVLIYSIFSLVYDLPYRGYADTPQHIGSIKLIENIMGIKENYMTTNTYPYLYRGDCRLGINFVVAAIMGSLIGVKTIYAIILLGIFNIILLLSSIFFLIKEYTRKDSVAFTTVALILALHPFGARIPSGYFSMGDLFLAHYPQIFGCSLVFISVALDLYWLRSRNEKVIIIKAVTFTTLLISHILSAVMYALLFLSLIISMIIEKKIKEAKEIILRTFIASSVGMVLAYFWPLHCWLNTVIFELCNKPVVPIIQTKWFRSTGMYLRIQDSLGVLLPIIVGIIPLIKKRRLFMIFISIPAILIGLVGLYVFLFTDIPIFMLILYRFLPLSRIPLIMGLSESLVVQHSNKIFLKLFYKNKKFKLTFSKRNMMLVLMTIFCILSIKESGIGWLFSLNNPLEDLGFLDEFDDGGVLLVEWQYTSYLVQAFSNFSTVLTLPPHYSTSNFKNAEEAYRRIDEVKTVLNNVATKKDLEGLLHLINQYNITHVLLSRKSWRSRIVADVLLRCFKAKILYSDDNFILLSRYKVYVKESNELLKDGESDLNEICIYDDNENFWMPAFWGEGNLFKPILTEEISNKVKGASSLKVTVLTGGSYGRSGIQHIYSSTQDWSGEDFLVIYLYASNRGGKWYINVECPDNNNYYHYVVNADFEGWKKFVIPLGAFKPVGSPSWKNVRKIVIVTDKEHTWYIDRTILDVGQKVEVNMNIPPITSACL